MAEHSSGRNNKARDVRLPSVHRVQGRVRLQLFGPARLHPGRGAPRALERHDALLLALLAIEGPMHRAHLACLLWPHSASPEATGNLRHAHAQADQLRLAVRAWEDAAKGALQAGRVGDAVVNLHNASGTASFLGQLDHALALADKASSLRAAMVQRAAALRCAGELAGAAAAAREAVDSVDVQKLAAGFLYNLIQATTGPRLCDNSVPSTNERLAQTLQMGLGLVSRGLVSGLSFKENMMNKLLVACGLMVVGASAFAAVIPPPNQVPEPATLVLVALAGVVGVLARRGKK